MGGVESSSAALLARGPWDPEDVDVRWHQAAYEPSAELSRPPTPTWRRCSERGSPAHDGMAARMRDHEAREGGLWLELQPARWSLRLVEGEASRLADRPVRGAPRGRPLARRPARGLAGDLGRALGAGRGRRGGGGGEPRRDAHAGAQEEWQLAAAWTIVEALVRLPNGVAMLVGQATVADAASPVMDAEHDEYAWWPPDPDRWPDEAEWPLRRMGALLA